MKKIKYFLFIIPLIFIFTNKVNAFTTTSYSAVLSTFTRPTSSNWYKEENIIDIFEQMKESINVDINFEDYSNVVVYSKITSSLNTSNNYTYYFCNNLLTGTPSKPSFNGICYLLDLNYYSNYVQLIKYVSTKSEVLYNNGLSSRYASNIFSSGVTYTLDFEPYLATEYMNLSILDSSYNVLSSVSCIDKSSEYCSITPISSDTRYLKVLYHLKPLIGRSLDIFNNSIQQVNTKILNTTNPYITAKQVYLEYNFNDSTSNVANNLYFVSSSNSYNVFNQSYNFIYSFKQNDIYNSISLYDFAVYYDLGAILYTGEIRIPYYITFKTITSGDGLPDEDSQEQQEQQQIDQNQVIIDNLDDINSSINNSNIGGASSDASNFFSNFSTDDFGLSSIITIPLSSINSLASSTCSPLSVPIPNTGKNITLPCMTQVYQEHVPEIFTLWRIVSFGIIAYFICIDIFHIVKGFKEPDSDKVEVLDL